MNSFDAILIDSSNQEGQREPGVLHVEHFQIRFESDQQTILFPLDRVNLAVGGAADRLIFFSLSDKPEISVYTSDHKILRHPNLLRYPALSEKIRKVKSRKRAFTFTVLTLISLVLAISVSIFLMKDFVVRKLAESAPVEWEEKIGDKLFQGLAIEYTFIENDSLEEIFLSAAAPLLEEVKKEGFNIDLYFTKDATINAFALPGGKVIIQSGLIDNAHSWDEVFGVLAHELAHVTQRHHLRGVINNVGIYALLVAFLGDISAIAGTVINLGGELGSLANSRKFELEADRVGMDYLVKAGMDTDGLITFFEVLKEKHGDKGEDALSFLSTHPTTDDRIEILKKMQASLPAYEPIQFTHSFESFRNCFNPIL